MQLQPAIDVERCDPFRLIDLWDRGQFHQPELLFYGHADPREAMAKVALQKLESTGTWVFHRAVERFIPTKYPTPVWDSGHCVYFLWINTKPHLIKIGHTKQLYARLKQLFRSEGKPQIMTLPFVYFPEREVAAHHVELFIHSQLAHKRAYSEWFELDAALSWASEVMGKAIQYEY